MAEINLNGCRANYDLQPYPDCPTRLFYVSGTATHSTLGEVATLRGFVLRQRFEWKKSGDFFLVMDDESEELMHFATDVFDDNTKVHPWLIDGGHRSGSGCWGEELNSGDIIYLENITVKEPYLRRGVGSWLLQQFIRSAHTQPELGVLSPTHIFCWPTSMTTSDSDENVVAFVRKNGFRRIGRTSFFCYSDDANHPSRKLKAEEDLDLLPKSEATPRILTTDELQAQFPLHTDITSNKNPDIVNVIKEAYALDPNSIHKADLEGFTPVHVAAMTENLHALRTLIDLGVSDDLKNLTNKKGLTPLDGLNDVMRMNRHFMDNLINTWEGFSTDSLACEYLLKKATEMPLLVQEESEYVAKRKLGCSCGNCLEGWFSERMKYRLEATAIVTHETMGDEMMFTSGRGRGRSHWESEAEDLMFDKAYIPLSLRPQIDRTFCRAWCSAFRAIYDILQGPNPILSPDSASFQLAMIEFTARGGKVEHVLDALTATAKEQSSLGDGSFEDAHCETYDELPTCDNDFAFNLVRRKLGLDPRLPWGPYYEDELYEDEDEDEGSDY